MELTGKMCRFSEYIPKAAKEVTNAINREMGSRLTVVMINEIHDKMLEELPRILMEMYKDRYVTRTVEVDFQLTCLHKECPKHFGVLSLHVLVDYDSGVMALAPFRFLPFVDEAEFKFYKSGLHKIKPLESVDRKREDDD